MHQDELVLSSQENSEDGEPLPPKSTRSLLRSETTSEPQEDSRTEDTSKRLPPVSFHLKTVTWESFNNLELPPDERFEVVDGLLLWHPMGHGTDTHQKVITGLIRLFNTVDPWSATGGVDVEVESLTGKSSVANQRSPDSIVTYRDSPAVSESPPSSPRVRKRKNLFRTKENPAYALIEVTSAATRNEDLTSKWLQYCLTGITFYIIIDLYLFETTGEACVVVGSKDAFADAVRCKDGNPFSLAASSTTKTTQRKSKSDKAICYKKVYKGDEQVNVGIFRDTPFTASQLMDPNYVKRRLKTLRQRGDELAKRNADLENYAADVTKRGDELVKQNALLLEKIAALEGDSVFAKTKTKPSPQEERPASPDWEESAKSLKSPAKSPPKSPQKKRPKHQSK